MKKAIASERVFISIRVPLESKAFLEKLADYHCSSISAVVVTILRDAERREARAQAVA
jgi:predicted transcriptional regulator